MEWVNFNEMSPGDNQCIDLWISYGDVEGRICNCFEDKDNDSFWCWDWSVTEKIRFSSAVATHWMPKPEPPKDK